MTTDVPQPTPHPAAPVPSVVSDAASVETDAVTL